MSDGGESDHPGRREAVEPSRRVGPVAFRLKAVWRFVVAVAAFAVLTSVIGTLTGLHHNMSGSTRRGERHYLDPVAATAEVGSCWRTGPIAWDALGYWWECDVLVRTVEGRVVRATVDRSMVTPDDVGRPVKFLELCHESGDECRYGKPDNPVLSFIAAPLTLVEILACLVLIIFALFALVDAVRGPDRAPRHAIGGRERPVRQVGSTGEPASRPPWSRDVTNG